MNRRPLPLPFMFAASLVAVACGPLQSPVVDNRSDTAYLALVTGISDGQDAARVIELPPGARTSLEHHAGLPDLYIYDVVILDASCTVIANFDVVDTFVGEGHGLPGSIVILPDGQLVRDAKDSGSAGTAAEPSDLCPPGAT